jgi:hypothetical protein
MGQRSFPEEIHDFIILFLSDHTCRIGAAPAAMGHLGKV